MLWGKISLKKFNDEIQFMPEFQNWRGILPGRDSSLHTSAE